MNGLIWQKIRSQYVPEKYIYTSQYVELCYCIMTLGIINTWCYKWKRARKSNKSWKVVFLLSIFSTSTVTSRSSTTTRTTTKRTSTPGIMQPIISIMFNIYVLYPDYDSLRHVGLAMAAVLFIMGIMVISCGKVCRLPKCHVGSTKSYRVV
uniref:FXYD domain-containing ion transport regulator n=1 Tax=Myripristis murdjan TaxID=586833 RepID=A0A667ZAU4_9TELE